MENITISIDNIIYKTTNVAMSLTSATIPLFQYRQNKTIQIKEAINDNTNTTISSISLVSSNKKRKKSPYLLENQNNLNIIVITIWNLSKIDYYI